jgi:hypothetical protein
MGLDSIVKYNNGTEFTSSLPIEISEKFKCINQYGIIGFNIFKYEGCNLISFRGKAYYYAIHKITSYNLYEDLNSEQLKIMHLKLNELINKYEDEEFVIDTTQIQEAFDNSCDRLTNWIKEFTNEYIPSPNEIKGLCELFKICYENDLQLFADY